MICPSSNPLDEYERLRRDKHLLPVKLTGHYAKLLKEEQTALGDSSGPLYRAMMPTSDKVVLSAPGENPDFVSDRQQIPLGSSGHFLHKYKDRVLFLPTHRCLAHCMYCFRQDLLEEEKSKEKMNHEHQLSELIDYLGHHLEVREVILSGGDPLMLPPQTLGHIFERLSQVQHIKQFRIHTRAPLFHPKALSSKHLDILIHFNVRIVLHCIHPYELNPELCENLKKAHQLSARLYNHFPLLRGVNDHPTVLVKLLENLDELGVRPLSIYFPEPVLHSAVYRISFKRIQYIVQQVQQNSPSWIHGLRFCQDTPHGKLQLHELDHIDEKNGIVHYLRDGKIIEVPDFPESLDQAGSLEKLLWKG
jgi:KamA family protein